MLFTELNNLKFFDTVPFIFLLFDTGCLKLIIIKKGKIKYI